MACPATTRPNEGPIIDDADAVVPLLCSLRKSGLQLLQCVFLLDDTLSCFDDIAMPEVPDARGSELEQLDIGFVQCQPNRILFRLGRDEHPRVHSL